jgi:hypothetical protein
MTEKTERKPLDNEAKLALILDDILSVALERLKERNGSDELFEQGMATAYYDILDRAEEMAEVVEYDLNSLGLDGQLLETRPKPPERKTG